MSEWEFFFILSICLYLTTNHLLVGRSDWVEVCKAGPSLGRVRQLSKAQAEGAQNFRKEGVVGGKKKFQMNYKNLSHPFNPKKKQIFDKSD